MVKQVEPAGAIGTQKVAGPQQPNVKQTVPGGQSAVVVQGLTQVGTMHTVAPSVVGTQAQPPGQLNVWQVSGVGQPTALTCA